MMITLLRGLEVDPYNLPDDFDEQITNAFSDYTEGTAEAYTFQDKLCFIDNCVKDCHGTGDADDIIMEDLKYRTGRKIEYGDFPEKDDYFSLEGMEYYYNMGKESQRLYSKEFGGEYHERHLEEAIEKMLIRIIKIIINWEAK